jgi:aryl-alcohol dehydrogenase-like predicted oxidoreductase
MAEAMNGTVKLGDREISRIGLGTNRLTHTRRNADFIKAATAAGVQMIDTAHLYTGGDSEKTIGDATSGEPGDRVIATKGGHGGAGRGKPEVLRAEIEQSLRSLRTDVIELYYLHQVDPETPLEESLSEIKAHQDAGKIRLVGVSNVTIEQIERARKVLPIAAVQNRYNIAERGNDEVIDYCTQEGLVFVPFFPLRAEVTQVIREVAGRHKVTPQQVMLAWLLRRSPAMLPIPGTLSLEHLEQNLAASKVELTDAEFRSLDD